MANFNQQMRELGGLVDNLYLQSKNRMGEASSTPGRQRKKVHTKNTGWCLKIRATGGTYCFLCRGIEIVNIL